MEICDKNSCSGCGACVNVCPTDCITLEYDKQGFLAPITDESRCIHCNKCRKTCPANNEYINNNFSKPTCIACYNKHENTVRNSSSGGAFTTIAEYVLEKGGTVFGSKIDETLRPYHIGVTEKSRLQELRGSKYIQSNIQLEYRKVEEYLSNDKFVFFVGTPCQIAGLYAYLGKKEYDKLLTADLVCHGVGSQGFFEKYIRELEEKHRDTIIHVDFRNKDKIKNDYVSKITFRNREAIYINSLSDVYMSCFLKNAIYRESCYTCRYAQIPRIGDITLGDFVGVSEKIIKKTIKRKGISVILLNNSKGKKIFEQVKSNMNFYERPIEESIKSNRNVSLPTIRPDCRDKILTERGTAKELMDKYCKFRLKTKILRKFDYGVVRILRVIYSSIKSKIHNQKIDREKYE